MTCLKVFFHLLAAFLPHTGGTAWNRGHCGAQLFMFCMLTSTDTK